MKKAEIQSKINQFNDNEFLDGLESRTPQEILAVASEITSVTDEIKCEYQWLKGRICQELKGEEDLETVLRTIRDFAQVEDEVGPCDVFSSADLDKTLTDQALEIVREEIGKLEGMYGILLKYADGVTQFCEIWLKAVFGADYDVMALPDPMVGRRNEDGSWDEAACRRAFTGIMLYLMDEYDVKSVPFRAEGALALDNIGKAEFPDVTIDRKAFVDMVQDLYFLDRVTVKRLQLDDAYFVRSAKAFLAEVDKALTPQGKIVVFGTYGLDTGTPLTLADMSEQYGLRREVIRQIQSKASIRLRHPLRCKHILGVEPIEIEFD